jgi:hypothetical protein
MMQYNATRALDDMVDQFHNFTRSVTKKLAFFLWTNPLKKMPMIQDFGGIKAEVTYSEEEQEGDFVDYSFDIDVHSLSRMNPELRYQKILQLFSGVIMPLAPIAANQGINLDVDKVVKECARYLNIPNLEEWWKNGMPPDGVNNQEPMQGSPSQPKSGQSNDSMGASMASKSANSNRAQTSGQSSKPSSSNKGK